LHTPARQILDTHGAISVAGNLEAVFISRINGGCTREFCQLFDRACGPDKAAASCKTAKALGLEIPPGVLAIVHGVIE
jgi:hypothetical protein